MSASIALEAPSTTATRGFVFAALTTITVSCVLAGWLPIGCSIVAVFLFAGPHNWMEARYMLTRMPPRWGKLRPFFLFGLIGVPTLTVLAAALPHAMRWGNASSIVWLTGIATWNSVLILWVTTLVHMRSRQNPRRDWPWTWPICFLLIALNWIWPLAWSIALVYLHPIVALWFLDRELAKRNPTWHRSFRFCVAIIPILLLLLWWRLAAAPNLPGNDILTMQITRHAGSQVLTNVSTHFLVAAHTFLEMIHYGVWIVAVPIITGSARWSLTNVPLAKRSQRFRILILSVLAFGVLLTLVLWGGFLADYPLTRDIYFSVAMLHVLAEVPFLLRLL